MHRGSLNERSARRVVEKGVVEKEVAAVPYARKTDHQAGACAGRGVDVDRAVVCVHDRRRDREAESGAGITGRPGVVQGAEPLEDLRPVVRRDARARRRSQ